MTVDHLSIEPPTFRKLKAGISEAAELLANFDGELTFENLRTIATSTATFLEDAYRDAVVDLAHAGLHNFELLAIRNPELREPILSAAFMLTLSAFQAVTYGSQEQINLERSRLIPLARRNAAKSEAVERSQTIAAELWQGDRAKDIRIGDMAERVYRALVGEGFTEALPGTAERIKEWIKPAAPDYARKGGRRRKCPKRIG